MSGTFSRPGLVLTGGLLAWSLYAFLFIARSPSGAFTHDFQSHLVHTRILYNQHRLALPREGWETYQPPLYYAVNTLFSPNRPSHAFWIRLMSVLYGALALFLMSRLLTHSHISPQAQESTLLFIATTPAFLFLFSTYNNDSLATLLSIAFLVVAYEWVHQRQNWQLIGLGILTTAGLYTKLNMAFPAGAVVTVLAVMAGMGKFPWILLRRLIGTLAVSVALLTPWLVGHNYRLTGRLTPVPADFPVFEDIRLPHTPLQTVLTPPGWTPGEWKDPYTHVWDKTNHKKNSYLAYVFDTSIFGEYTFAFLPPVLPWAILFLHAGLWIGALWRVRRSPYGVLAVSFIALGLLGLMTIFFRAPYAGLMDFRYVAWLWLPIALLFSAVLASASSEHETFFSPSLFRVVMLLGTFLHVSFWLILFIGGQWNIPK